MQREIKTEKGDAFYQASPFSVSKFIDRMDDFFPDICLVGNRLFYLV